VGSGAAFLIRSDGLVPGVPFFAVLLFDKGYYAAVTSHDLGALRAAVTVRTARVKSLVACTVPFEGMWRGHLPDVTLPEAFEEELVTLNRQGDD
jgi:hypothetical protein